MGNKMYYIFLVLGLTFSLSAQSVGIGTPIPDSSAIMDVKSTTKGLLIPRMNTLQRDAIVNPAVGLQIFNNDDNTISFFDGVKWSKHGTQVDVTTTNTSWVRKADFGGGYRTEAVGFSIGDKGYIGTGGYNRNDFWEYDPQLNIWTQKADFGGIGRQSAVGFSIGNKGYIGTGSSNPNGSYIDLDDFWEFDPTLNIWTQKADFGGIERQNAVGFSIGDKGFIGTGRNSFDDLNDFWEYNPTTNSWVQKANFGGEARFGAVGFSIGNKGYIGTGNPYNNGSPDFWEYEPTNNIWTLKSSFIGLKRVYGVGFSIGNKGYIGSGQFGGDFKGDLWEYDPSTNIWILKSNFMELSRENAVAFSINNKGYIGTGFGNVLDSRKNIWEFNPNSLSLLEYSETSPSYTMGNHSWTTESNKIKTSSLFVNTIIPGNLAVDGRITNSLKFPSTIHDKKIVLYDRPASSSYLGFGVEPYTLRYQVASSGDKHEFGPLLTLYGTGDAVLSGCLTTVNFNCPSDLILKKNILPMANSLSHLLALKGYRYNWIDANKNTTKQSGVLAQEVQEIFPHLVQENHKGMLSVNYIGLVPEIIETFKEIKSQSDKMSSDLLKRIEVLENQKKNQHER